MGCDVVERFPDEPELPVHADELPSPTAQQSSPAIDALAPTILIAAPVLEDGFFAHAVILLVDRGEHGAGGMVLNRVAPVDLDSLLQAGGLDHAPGGPQPVWIGGPVAPEAGLVLYLDEGGPRYEHDLEVMPGLRLSASMAVLRDISHGKGPKKFGLFLGRAGWGPGQLEREIAEGAWLSCEPRLDLLFGTATDDVWHQALQAIGLDEAHLFRGIAEA